VVRTTVPEHIGASIAANAHLLDHRRHQQGAQLVFDPSG